MIKSFMLSVCLMALTSTGGDPIDEIYEFGESIVKPSVAICNHLPSTWAPYPRYKDCDSIMNKMKRDSSSSVVVSFSAQDYTHLQYPGYSCSGVRRVSACTSYFFGAEQLVNTDSRILITPSRCQDLISGNIEKINYQGYFEEGFLGNSDCQWTGTNFRTTEKYHLSMTNVSFDWQTGQIVTTMPLTRNPMIEDENVSLTDGGMLIWKSFPDKRKGCHRESYGTTVCEFEKRGSDIKDWILNCPDSTMSLTFSEEKTSISCTVFFNHTTLLSDQGTMVTLLKFNDSKTQESLDKWYNNHIGKNFDISVDLDESETPVSDSSAVSQFSFNILQEYLNNVTREIMMIKCHQTNMRIASAFSIRKLSAQNAGNVLSDRRDIKVRLGESAVGIHRCFVVKNYKIIRMEDLNNQSKTSLYIPAMIPPNRTGFIDPVFFEWFDTSPSKSDQSPRIFNLRGPIALNYDGNQLIKDMWETDSYLHPLPNINLQPDKHIWYTTDNIYQTLEYDIKKVQNSIKYIVSSTDAIYHPENEDENSTHDFHQSGISKVLSQIWSIAGSVITTIMILIAVISLCYCCCPGIFAACCGCCMRSGGINHSNYVIQNEPLERGKSILKNTMRKTEISRHEGQTYTPMTEPVEFQNGKSRIRHWLMTNHGKKKLHNKATKV